MRAHEVVVAHLKHAHSINQLSHLIVLLSFLITFFLARVTTYLQALEILPNQTGDVHIHHLVPGIILLLIAGYCAISFWSNLKLHLIMSGVFGIGAALTVDEFSLWVFLRDVYWHEEGRHSIDATIVVIIILLITYVVGQVEVSRRRSRNNQ